VHLYVELWKARPAWLALEAAERTAYVEQLGPAIASLLDAGIELVGFAVADADAPYDAAYPYLAVWRMPTLDLVHRFEQAIEGAGWHRYFEQVNARGAIQPAADVLAHSARAQQP
jgi:hypothetical protein